MKGIIKTSELSFWDEGDKVDVIKCWSNMYGNWVRIGNEYAHIDIRPYNIEIIEE